MKSTKPSLYSISLGLAMCFVAYQKSLSASFVVSPSNKTSQQVERIDFLAGKSNNQKMADRSYHNRRIYRQNEGIDPFSWALSGPAIDAAANRISEGYYGQYNFYSTPRNYIYYDWGW